MSIVTTESRGKNLFLPRTYEDIEQRVGKDTARLLQFIVPVLKAERELTILLNDIQTSGNLVFVYGVTGSGKSTFIKSLLYQNRLPIRELYEIDTDSLVQSATNQGKLSLLYQRLVEIASAEKSLPESNRRSVVVINYLENLHGAYDSDVRAFFRDLNPLLRRTPLLILWPVTDKSDANAMLNVAQRVASTLFNRRQPVMDFTGPEINDFGRIAKNTVLVLNAGRGVSDFGLTDDDLDGARRQIEAMPRHEQTIRRYFDLLLSTWERRTNYISEVMRHVQIPTEIWFVVCYPGAETKIGPFSTKSTGITEDNWSANIAKLQEYTRKSQDAARWREDRLTLALGALPTKILYLPTNSFINAIAAYGPETPNFPVSHEMFWQWRQQENWFHKSKSRLTLARSPIIRQLAGLDPTVGERRTGGNVQQAIEDATKPFEEISKRIPRQWSDKPFNYALRLALEDAYANPPTQENYPLDRPTLVFHGEIRHPYMNITPDILIEVQDTKYVCIEMHYTTKARGGVLAHYILNKLDDYMTQWEALRDGCQPRLL